VSFFELLEQRGHVKPLMIAASSIFYEVATDNLSGTYLSGLLEEAMLRQLELILSATAKYIAYPASRRQEVVALRAASIRATAAGETETFDKQDKIRRLIIDMMEYEPSRTAYVLSELLTERIEPHN
jgi:hypothetical protein